MARDTTLEQAIEATLQQSGVSNSGEIAEIISDVISEWRAENPDPEPAMVTPTHGELSQEEHTAFILRIFLYLVTIQQNGLLEVDLSDVLKQTKGKLLQVRLEEGKFFARTTQGVILPQLGGLQ